MYKIYKDRQTGDYMIQGQTDWWLQ